MTVRGIDEAIIDGFVDEGEEVVVVPIHIQQTHLYIIIIYYSFVYKILKNQNFN